MRSSFDGDMQTRSFHTIPLPLNSMATSNPEEFFAKGLMEQAPPSPPIFLDLPRVPDGGNNEGRFAPSEMMLPYISYMLMEDNIDDDVSDHPALLQVQQPFAQLLSAPSIGVDNGKSIDRDNIEGVKDLLQDGNGDRRTPHSTFSVGADVVEAFLKGMEDAKMFLPKGDRPQRDEPMNQMFRKRSIRRENLEEVSMPYEAVMMGPKEISANEMFDEMMLRENEVCNMVMEKLHISVVNKGHKIKKKRYSNTTGDIVDLPELLMSCAEAMAMNDQSSAQELLKKIRQHASATGNATQRLAQCFLKGLEARLLGTGSQLWQLLMAERPSIVEFLEAYDLYMAACCFTKVALIFSIMTIMEAMVGKTKLHIVDYGLDYGFHWASLLRMLANREGGPPEVKITAIGRHCLRSCPVEEIEETGCRLRKCADVFGLPSFKFRAITTKWEDVSIQDLNTDTNEVLIVHDLFNFSTLIDESVLFDNPTPRDTVLNNIKKMKPDVFIQSIVNCSQETSFLSRFRRALFYYTSLFDILDETVPRGSKPRLVLEQVLFGRSALNVIACEGMELVDHPENYKQWQARNRRVGLRQLPLKPDIVKALRDSVKKHHKDFLLNEDDQWLLQGWMGRILFAHSTWVAEDTCPI
ncbi:hypothetical protein ACP4OV_003380 [Aristida adscensionis]